MHIFINLLKILLILVLLALMLSGGACVMFGLKALPNGDTGLIVGIGFVTLTVSGWLAWLLGRSLGRKSAPDEPQAPAEPPPAP